MHFLGLTPFVPPSLQVGTCSSFIYPSKGDSARREVTFSVAGSPAAGYLTYLCQV